MDNVKVAAKQGHLCERFHHPLGLHEELITLGSEARLMTAAWQDDERLFALHENG